MLGIIKISEINLSLLIQTFSVASQNGHAGIIFNWITVLHQYQKALWIYICFNVKDIFYFAAKKPVWCHKSE